MPDLQQTSNGVFVPTTNIWEIQQLEQADVQSDDFKRLLVRLYQNINTICLALNVKESAYYDQQEFLNSQLFFPNPVTPTGQRPTYRQAFRMVVNFGALPNAGTTSVAHGITIGSTYTFTRIYGTATNSTATSFLPLPYASTTLNENIEINIDDTNINITTGIDYSDYTTTYVIFEYIKS